MDLIEQLGSYEKAKAFLNAASYTIDELIMMQRSGLRPQHVEKALLEYRRQHNIFEVGDAMVIPSRGNGIFHFNALFSDSDIAEERHATDAEIEAGHRLPEKEVL